MEYRKFVSNSINPPRKVLRSLEIFAKDLGQCECKQTLPAIVTEKARAPARDQLRALCDWSSPGAISRPSRSLTVTCGPCPVAESSAFPKSARCAMRPWTSEISQPEGSWLGQEANLGAKPVIFGEATALSALVQSLRSGVSEGIGAFFSLLHTFDVIWPFHPDATDAAPKSLTWASMPCGSC